jgi:cardiolipin synthase A/B
MPVFKHGHHLQLICGSGEYFAALVHAMDAATHEVRLETYIFDFTASGQDVANSLIRAAARGVKVYLLMDGAGTEHIPQEWQARFDAAGVQWRVYNPLGRLGLLIPSRWRRLHRKLCVMDGGTNQAVGFCGGINILDDFHDPNHGSLSKPRFDFAVCVRGGLVSDIFDATRSLWLRQNAFARLRERKLRAAADSWASAKEVLSRKHTRSPLSPLAASEPVALATSAHFATAALLLRDNVRHRRRIERAYLKAVSQATQEIIIANAYFLPGGKLRRALLDAAQRGVKVKLLLQGRYEYFMQYHAARPVYDTLLSAGIEIHEYATSFLHAKVAVVDAYSAKAWATVGSSNLDPLSLLLAREANVVVLDGAFARDLRERLMTAMTQDGKQVQHEEFANRPWLQRQLDRLAYGLMRLMLSISGRRY